MKVVWPETPEADLGRHRSCRSVGRGGSHRPRSRKSASRGSCSSQIGERLFYTVGAIVYARRRPDPRPAVLGYHEVFHLCTIAAAAIPVRGDRVLRATARLGQPCSTRSRIGRRRACRASCSAADRVSARRIRRAGRSCSKRNVIALWRASICSRVSRNVPPTSSPRKVVSAPRSVRRTSAAAFRQRGRVTPGRLRSRSRPPSPRVLVRQTPERRLQGDVRVPGKLPRASLRAPGVGEHAQQVVRVEALAYHGCAAPVPAESIVLRSTRRAPTMSPPASSRSAYLRPGLERPRLVVDEKQLEPAVVELLRALRSPAATKTSPSAT